MATVTALRGTQALVTAGKPPVFAPFLEGGLGQRGRWQWHAHPPGAEQESACHAIRPRGLPEGSSAAKYFQLSSL